MRHIINGSWAQQVVKEIKLYMERRVQSFGKGHVVKFLTRTNVSSFVASTETMLAASLITRILLPCGSLNVGFTYWTVRGVVFDESNCMTFRYQPCR